MLKKLFCIVAFLCLTAAPGLYAQTGDSAIVVPADSVNLETPPAPVAAALDTVSREMPLSETVVSDSGYRINYVKRSVRNATIRRYQGSPDYAYANDPSYWADAPSKSGNVFGFLNSRFFRWVIFSLLGAAVLYGIFQLTKEFNFHWLIRKRKPGIPEVKKSGPGIPEDYDSAIRDYESNADYRMAVRYLYLRTLRLIKNKGIIEVNDTSTNTALVAAFSGNPGAGEFKFLTTAYDYIFYGSFIPDQALFLQIKNRFNQFDQKLGA